MVPQNLRDNLTLTLETIAPQVQDTWLPELAGHPVRAGLLGNPRLARRIVTDMCGGIDPDPAGDLDEVVEPERLAGIFDEGFAAAVRRLGAAWHSNTIAQLATAGTLAEALPELSLQEARAALQFRDLAPEAAPEGAIAQVHINADGRACLKAWLDRQPPALLARLRCIWPLEGSGTAEAPRAARVRLADAVLGQDAA